MNMKFKSLLFLFVFFISISLLWIVSSYLLKEKQINKKNTYMKILKLTPILYSNDVHKSIEFYTQNLNFNVLSNKTQNGETEFAILNNGEFELVIMHDTSNIKGENNFITLYFEIANTQKIYDEIKNKVKILKPIEKTFYGTKEFSLSDNLGNKLTFAERLN